MNETWLPIPGFSGVYEISNFGNCRRTVTHNSRWAAGRLLTPHNHRLGYLRYCLSINKKSKAYYAHRLVMLAFVGEPPAGKQDVNHIDGNPSNNKLSNLEYVSTSENVRHAIDVLGKVMSDKGALNPHSKFTDLQILHMRRLAEAGETYAALGEIFNTDPTNVSLIVRRKTWSHI